MSVHLPKLFKRAKPKRATGYSHARPSTRFQTLATLNIQPLSREMLVAWRPKILAGILLALLLAVLYEFFVDDGFFIPQVQTAGLNILTPREIENASGLAGYNVFFADPSQVERALGKLPEIKSASAMIGIPNTVLIQIQERVPELVWLSGEQAFWIDADATAFPARLPRSDLPTVRDLSPTVVQPGKRVNPPAFNAVRALRLAWRDTPKSFEWSLGNGLAITDERGWKIYFGDASDMDFKVMKLKALLPRLVAQGARVKFIDLGKGDAYYQ